VRDPLKSLPLGGGAGFSRTRTGRWGVFSLPNTFIRAEMAAGFSQEQAEFMDEALAKHPHTHDIEDIGDLEERLEDIESGGDEDSGETE